MANAYQSHRVYKWSRWSTGVANSEVGLKQVYKNSFGYTDSKKIVAAGTTTAVLGATATALTAQTISANITNPDVPRALSVTVGGTASSILDSAIVVTGTNVEGKVITESFQTTAAGTGTINGSKAFKTVTSVTIPAQAGTAGTIAVGTQNKLGVFHRLFPNNTTVKVVSYTAIGSAATLQAAPTVVANETVLERNLVTPTTTPNGTTFLVILYNYDNYSVGDINDNPSYFTSTSTSTSSTSTSTTTTPPTSTSTSSTSTSSTSTSISTSSTSTSSTSVSTSTTTTP